MHKAEDLLVETQEEKNATAGYFLVKPSRTIGVDPKHIRIPSLVPIVTPGSNAQAAQVGSLISVTEPQASLLDAPVASTLPVVIPFPMPTAASTSLITKSDATRHNLPAVQQIFLGQNGKAYVLVNHGGRRYVLAVGSRQLNLIIRDERSKQGIKLRSTDLKDINESLQAQAEMAGITRDVWYRVAPIPGGVEIDLGDAEHARVRITAGKVEIVTEGSETLFYRTPVMHPMVMPTETGDLDLLKKYLNLHPVSIMLFIAWLTYTLAHPKTVSSKFLILVLHGNQGSGKTWLCSVIKALIDPCAIRVQMLPGNGRDLAIDSQNAHVLCYDNVRDFKPSMADILCVASTGGALATRQLFTDSDQQVHRLHAALVLNGIHAFIDQPDLAQRCLTLDLLPLSGSQRRSEAQLISDFQNDLPAILRGLFNLVAEILKYLPTAEVTNPERMMDFVHWLAGMEKADGVRAGDYQAAYSDVLNDGQRDTLLDNVLGAAILSFSEDQCDGEKWSGTPAELLSELNKQGLHGVQRSREWPGNPIALSKRLMPLRAALLSQGITIELHRGKQRTITIKKSGEKHV